jgi:hypothetical protein
MTETLKAISMWQPWGSLWLSPAKRHETRHWQTRHRGRLLVHAAKKFIKDVDPDLRDILDDEFGGHWAMDLTDDPILRPTASATCGARMIGSRSGYAEHPRALRRSSAPVADAVHRAADQLAGHAGDLIEWARGRTRRL